MTSVFSHILCICAFFWAIFFTTTEVLSHDQIASFLETVEMDQVHVSGSKKKQKPLSKYPGRLDCNCYFVGKRHMPDTWVEQLAPRATVPHTEEKTVADLAAEFKSSS